MTRKTKLLILVSPIILVISICLFRALVLFKPPPEPEACKHLKKHDRITLNDAILNRFKAALNLKTVSYKEYHYEPEELLKMIDLLEASFPRIHKSAFVKRELLCNYSLVYTVSGTNPKLRPYLLTSHMDVVPVTRDQWTSDPFDAVVKEDKHIYARGTIDAKHTLMSMLEAFEFLLSKGYRPKRSFYLVFGHDEEVSGVEGAQILAGILRSRLDANNHDKLEYILDEGNVIITTRFPGVDRNVGLIGVVEKGYMNVKVSTVGKVGHSSMPTRETAISKLAKAIGKFHAHIMPSFMGYGVERGMLDIFAAHSSWPLKLVYANFWLFKPILGYVFTQDPSLDSVIRTSTAVTMIEGGTKVNVLPNSAAAYINHRLHPYQTLDEVLESDRQLINDPTVTVELHGSNHNPTPIAPYCDRCFGFQLVKQSTLQIYPGTVVVPSVFLAASDSRFYTNLTDAIYKFSAIAIPLEELKRFHGHDERISLENYENLINFYHHLIQNSDSSELEFTTSLHDEL